METEELKEKLELYFERIWRCAESNKWDIINGTNLLSFDWIDKEINYKEIDIDSLTSGKMSIVPFVNDLRINDLIFIMGKNSFQGICISKSEYNFEGPFLNMGNSGEKPAINIEYIYKSINSINHSLETHNNPATFSKIDQYNFGLFKVIEFLKQSVPDAYNALKNYINVYNDENKTKIIDSNNKNMKQPLNQILYGPPGTGKTYNTINYALKILEKNIQGLTRTEIKEIFDQMVNEGRIVFTTFHQSMSYEDFIEGIKPKLDDGDGDEHLKYEIKDGIFKILCNRINNIIKLNQNNLKNNKSFNNFSELYDAFVIKLKEILDDLEESDKHYFESRRSKVLLLSVEGNTILTSGEKANTTETIQKEKLERIYNKFNSPEEITNIVKQLREVGTDIGWTTNYYAVFKSLKDFENANKRDDITDSSFLNNFVLIIDEINRGNVSQIFGELITLIEEDKRSGMGEELEITLPYSKKSFSVPPNLYIIGTMNTADRSVEALDSALRRRFHFIEMPPEPNLIKTEGKSKDKNGIVDGIDLKDLLTTINNRIEKLLDKDHLIGHSYFMDVAVIEDLMSAFQNKIIPLLQEYFFGDYGKIGLILGEGFFDLSQNNEEDIFAKFGEYDVSAFSDRIVYKQKDLNKMDSNDFKSAITELLGNKSDSE